MPTLRCEAGPPSSPLIRPIRLSDRFQQDWARPCQQANATKQPLLQLLVMKWKIFCRYLETLFTPRMTWSNYGSVLNSDHVLPLSAFRLNYRLQRRLVCCFVNLLPLTIANALLG